jgi:hypothetical protein
MEPQIKLETGVNDIFGGGAIGFTANRFTQPPVVVCQIMRSTRFVFNANPVYFYVTNVTKDSFSHTVRGARRDGDRVSWIAIGI